MNGFCSSADDWLLDFRLITHTEQGGKFPPEGGCPNGCQTQREALVTTRRGERRREAAQRHHMHAVATNTCMTSSFTA